MNRFLAFLAALALSGLAVTSACTAVAPGMVSFRLEARQASDIVANFTGGKGNKEQWSSSFRPGQLAGLDVARLRASGDQPIAFTVVRDAGRFDCTGRGGRSSASGQCRFGANPAFVQTMVRAGMDQPTEEEGLRLMALDTRSATIEAIRAARYPVPTVNDLLELTALGADAAYISGLARVGYHPPRLRDLVEFRALGVTPDFIQGFVRHGFGNLPPKQLVELKALGIDADFVAGFAAAGFRGLTVDQLVELKAVGVTPDYAREVSAASAERPSVDRLVELRALNFRPR